MLKTIASALLATKDLKLKNQISSILIQNDCSVINGKTAIESISQFFNHHVDFMILDWESYNSDHKVIIDIIKKARPRVPIIVLTEDNSLETVRKLTQSSVFHVAIKPIEKNEMEKLIEAVKRFHKKRKTKIEYNHCQ